jgi:dihydrofolate reductase
MKTIAYFTLSADGFLPRAEEKGLPPHDQVIADSMEVAEKAGAMILGRTTFEETGEDESPVQVVVVSKGPLAKPNGALVADSPAKALQLLEEKGFSSAMVGGGAQLFSSFLGLGLVDELYVNIAPELLGKGLRIETPQRHAGRLKLIDTASLDRGVIQLHYRQA